MSVRAPSRLLRKSHSLLVFLIIPFPHPPSLHSSSSPALGRSASLIHLPSFPLSLSLALRVCQVLNKVRSASNALGDVVSDEKPKPKDVEKALALAKKAVQGAKDAALSVQGCF